MLASTNNTEPHIYWERQGSDRLCAVHCLNSLIQGAFLNEVQLAQIAQELDQQERDLFLQAGTDSKDLNNFLSSPSNNVADDGNYNIQVISEALKRVSDLKVDSIDSVEARNAGDLSGETGFICNSSSHWFAIRKINNKWYNLNSTNRKGPEFISDFYLSAFLHSVRENGYIIFVVVGKFPITSPQMFSDLQKHQFWFSESKCTELHQQNIKKKNYKLNVGGTDERDLEKAIAASKKGAQMDEEEDDEFEFEEGDGPSKNFGDISKKPEEKSFEAFKGQGVSLSDSSTKAKDLESYFSKYKTFEDDPELSFAMLLSMKEAFTMRPEPSKDNMTLNFRLPNGKSINFVFSNTTTIDTLYDFVKVNLSEEDRFMFAISTMYPRKQLTTLGISIEAAGLQDMDALLVEKLA